MKNTVTSLWKLELLWLLQNHYFQKLTIKRRRENTARSNKCIVQRKSSFKALLIIWPNFRNWNKQKFRNYNVIFWKIKMWCTFSNMCSLLFWVLKVFRKFTPIIRSEGKISKMFTKMGGHWTVNYIHCTHKIKLCCFPDYSAILVYVATL